jgi:hypothetical protein
MSSVGNGLKPAYTTFNAPDPILGAMVAGILPSLSSGDKDVEDAEMEVKGLNLEDPVEVGLPLGDDPLSIAVVEAATAEIEARRLEQIKKKKAKRKSGGSLFKLGTSAESQEVEAKIGTDGSQNDIQPTNDDLASTRSSSPSVNSVSSFAERQDLPKGSSGVLDPNLSVWKQHKKNFFVLSSAGKPIYAR